MVLYHFCPAHLVDSILVRGLNRGKLPVLAEAATTLIERCQWLTSEPDATKQSWATSSLIPYSRTAYRLTVQIPKSHCKKLIAAVELAKKMPGDSGRIITDWEDSDKWYVFYGNIPPKWIVGCHPRRKK